MDGVAHCTRGVKGGREREREGGGEKTWVSPTRPRASKDLCPRAKQKHGCAFRMGGGGEDPRVHFIKARASKQASEKERERETSERTHLRRLSSGFTAVVSESSHQALKLGEPLGSGDLTRRPVFCAPETRQDKRAHVEHNRWSSNNADRSTHASNAQEQAAQQSQAWQ